jgi:stage V sporulation protein D (sporulation-specific penicillin-binding protein)
MEKTVEKIIKKFTSRMQARLLLVFCVISLLMVGLMGRLVYIVQADGDKYAKQVLSRESYVSSVLPYKRGDILDCNGTVLAHSELQYRLILDPMLLLENEDRITATLKVLKEDFGIDNKTINTILKDKPKSQYVILLKNLKYDVVQTFEKDNDKSSEIAGIWFEEEYVRTYPNNSLASDVIGFSTTDNTGYYGIEEYYNDELNGTNGREYGYYDADLNIDRTVKEAVNGNTVVSAINADVQRIIQKKIIEFNTETGSKSTRILVMNPNNGEIIAMASDQEYNLNSPRSLEGIYTKAQIDSMTEEQKTLALNTLWKNDVISSIFEPGSTYKPMTIAGALEENLVSDSSTFYCDGSEDINGSIIHCSNRAGHGELTLGQALMKSCNDALMQIGAREGNDIFSQYQKIFGMGQKTGIDLPGEEAGIIVSADDMGPTDLATNSFGQNFDVNMVQMASAFSSVINGGYYYQPHVIKKIVNDNGATVKEFNKILVRQTVSAQTSDLLKQYLYQTVETGTASGAKVEGYSIGGKTGTAQKLPRADKTYLVSFLGFAPADNPQMVIYVVIDEPQNVVKQADSSIATKFASKILNEILPVLGIYPDGEIDYLLPTNAPTPTPDPSTGGKEEQNSNPNESGDNQTAEGNTQEKTESSDFNPDALE